MKQESLESLIKESKNQLIDQSFKFAINHNVNEEGLVEQNDGVKRILITNQPTPKRSDLLATINQTSEPEF